MIFFILIGTMNGFHSGWNSLENYAPAVRRLEAERRKKPVVRGLSEADRMSPFEHAGQNVRTGGDFCIVEEVASGRWREAAESWAIRISAENLRVIPSLS